MTTDDDAPDITAASGFDPGQVAADAAMEAAAQPVMVPANPHGYPLFDHRPKSAHGKRLLRSKWHLLMQAKGGKQKELAGAELEEAIVVTCGRMIGRKVTEDEKKAHSLIEGGKRYWWNTETNRGK